MKRITKLNVFIPPHRQLSEKEMSELIHRNKVIERKHQIELTRLDNEIPTRTFDLKSYRTPKQKLQLFKKTGLLLRFLLP